MSVTNKRKAAFGIVFIMIIMIISIFLFTGCGAKTGSDQNADTAEPENREEIEGSRSDETPNPQGASINVRIGDEAYVLVLENNETADAFAEMLPAEYEMEELNGNEKYIYIDNTLPSDPKIPDMIRAGDVCLYGNDCIVVFYKSFSPDYSYTRIGHIDDLPDLGNGTVTVKFGS